MANLARVPNPKVNQYALVLSTGIVDKSIGLHSHWSGSGFCYRLDAWLRSTYHYRAEEKEILRTPEFMLNDLEMQGYSEGDCDDVATLSCALAKSVGIPSRLTAIASTADNPNRNLDHVFAECLESGEWVPIDPTVEPGTVYSVYSVYHETV